MATFTNPKGSPAVLFDGPTAYTQQQLADECRNSGPRLQVPEGIDGTRLLWALAGRESSFGADCRPRHEDAYCLGRYSAALREETRLYGHAAHCSFGPWQLMYANTPRRSGPGFMFSTLDVCAAATVEFLNREILGRQKAQTVEQVADAYNSGNFRDSNVPTAYISDVLHYYRNVPLPPARTVTLHAAADGYDLYRDLMDAMLSGSNTLVGVPVSVEFAGTTRTIVGCDIRWITDEDGKHLYSITLKAI